MLFDQESMKQVWRTGWCIVMIKLPSSCCPLIWSFSHEGVGWLPGNTLWKCFRFMVHTHDTAYHRSRKKKVNMILMLLNIYLAFFWPTGWWISPLWRLHFGFLGHTHRSMTHHKWASCSGSLNRHSLACPARLPFKIASTLSLSLAASAQI